MTAFDLVLARIAERTGHPTRGSGDQRYTRCPAHDDGKPSLSVHREPDRVLLCCHTGCTVPAILEVLGLTERDLFDEPRNGSGYRAVAHYDYEDEQGKLLFQVERREPKDFRQRRPDGRGGWTWNLGDTRRVIYRLPQVLEAVAAGTTVHVVEGEKDVHAVEAAGAVGTCNPGGAGKWRPEYGDMLAGAAVVVVADKDGPGRAHAQQVAADVEGKAATVRLVQPAAGKDVADHLGAGHGLGDLVEADQDAPEGEAPEEAADGHRRVRVRWADAVTMRPVRWLWDGRVPLGEITLFGGREDVGKSTLAYTLIAQVTRGTLPGRYFGQPRPVLVAAAEDSWEHTIAPRLAAAGADMRKVGNVDVVTSGGVDSQVSLPADLDRLEHTLRDTGAVLLLLDPLLSRLGGNLDTHKDADVRVALEPVKAVADRSGAAVIGLIHVNKSGSSDPLSLLMGSRAFAAVSRSVLFVMADPDDEATRLLGHAKSNLSVKAPTLTFRIDEVVVVETDEGPVKTGKLTWTGERAQTIREVLESSTEEAETRSAIKDAGGWLQDFLTSKGGRWDSADTKVEGLKAGHKERTLKRARKPAGVTSESCGYPRRTYWSWYPLAEPGPAQSGQDASASRAGGPGEDGPTELTNPTKPRSEPVGPVGPVGPDSGTPRARGPIGEPDADWWASTTTSACPNCAGPLDVLDEPGPARCSPRRSTRTAQHAHAWPADSPPANGPAAACCTWAARSSNERTPRDGATAATAGWGSPS